MFRCFFPFILVSSCAFAADLPSRPAPLYKPEPISSWGGLYAGVQLGVASNEYLRNETTWRTLGLLNPKETTLSALYGAHIGYGVQRGYFVYGAVADVTFNGVKRDGTASNATSFTAEVSNNFTVRGKVGYLFSKDVMLFAAAGFAGGTVEVKKAAGSSSAFKVGYALGGGAEYRFSPNISLGLEYRYTELQAHNFATINNDKILPNFSDIRLLMTYRF